MDAIPTELPRLTDEQRKLIPALSDAIQAQVARIQSELSTFLISDSPGQYSEHRQPVAAVTVTIRAETGEATRFSADAGAGPYCMTVREICGKGLTGYIYCSVTYCVDVISGAG